MNRSEVEAMIRQILATLKYREIPALIGRTVRITSVETAPEEVLAGCRDALPVSARFGKPGVSEREGTLATYGILDLTYRIDPIELRDIEPGGPALARDLGLFGDLEDMLENEGGWESLLWEEIAEGNAYARLFLRAWEELTSEERENRRKYGVSADFSRQTYRVLDACLTNADLVWLNKHFYA